MFTDDRYKARWVLAAILLVFFVGVRIGHVSNGGGSDSSSESAESGGSFASWNGTFKHTTSSMGPATLEVVKGYIRLTGAGNMDCATFVSGVPLRESWGGDLTFRCTDGTEPTLPVEANAHYWTVNGYSFIRAK